MKFKLLILFAFLSQIAFSQHAPLELGLGYTYAAPINTMRQHIRQGNGFTMDFYVIPEKNKRLAFGADLNFTIYGHDKNREEYTLSDGTVAPMDIVVDNSFTNLMGSFRYYITPPEGKTIKPYVTFKAGYSWFRTSLNIYDPDDKDHCEPVETNILYKDGTILISGGGGFHWDLLKKKSPDTFLFNIGASLTLGGKVNYLNTDAPSGPHNHDSTVNASFRDTRTQTTHEHHVGFIYNSFAEMVEFRAGFLLRMRSFCGIGR